MAAQFDTQLPGASPLTARTDLYTDEVAPRAANQTSQPAQTLQLTRFMPFRLNRLATGISESLSEVYKERFGLEIPEWRVVATVGPAFSCTAQHIADTTRMHKTRVSRAIANLVKRGLIERTSNADDRREMELRLTKAGRVMYNELVPLALERERALFACMSEEELRALTEGLERLEEFLGLGG